jgi:biopolymer transport protein ExbD
MFHLIIPIIITLFIIFIITLAVIIRKTKRAIHKVDSSEEQERQKSFIQYYLTDGGYLIRRNKEIWEVFDAKSKNWVKPTFDMGDIFSANLLSNEEAGEIIKKMLKS